MSVLEQVLQYKEQQRQKELADIGQVSTAVQLFQQSKQIATENRMKELMLKTDLAKSGIKINKDGAIERDESLMSPVDQLITRGKAADAARSLGDRDLLNSIIGGQSPNAQPPSMQQPTPMQPQQPQDDLSQYVSEIDPLTQQPTARAIRAKNQLDLEKQKNELQQKAQVPTVQQRNDLTATENQLTNLNELKTLASKVPAGRIKGTLSGLRSSISGGELDTDTRQYLKQRPAYAVSIYRALTGDTRLSDSDAKARALPLLWHPTESAKIREDSFKTIEKAMEARKRLILQGRYTQDKDGQFITPLQDVLAEAEQAGTVEEDKTLPAQNPIDGNPKLRELISGLPTSFGPGKVNLNKSVEDMIAPSATFLNNALSVPFTDISPKSGLEKLGISFPESNTPSGKVLDAGFGVAGSFAPFGIINSLLKARQLAKTAELVETRTKPVAQGVVNTAQSALTKLKGDEIINRTITTAKNSIMGKGGYIQKEHQLYSKAIDTIKGSDKPIKNSSEVLRDFALKHRDETTLKFKTPEMEKVYSDLSQKLTATGKITESDIVTSMKILKGKFKGKVDSTTRMNLNAASDLSKGLAGKSANILKTANSRYSQFKNNEKNIDQMLDLYSGKAKKTDDLVNSLLNKDLGIEQSNVAKLIGEQTGVDLINTINYYRGLNQMRNAFWLTRQMENFGSGVTKLLNAKISKKP